MVSFAYFVHFFQFWLPSLSLWKGKLLCKFNDLGNEFHVASIPCSYVFSSLRRHKKRSKFRRNETRCICGVVSISLWQSFIKANSFMKFQCCWLLNAFYSFSAESRLSNSICVSFAWITPTGIGAKTANSRRITNKKWKNINQTQYKYDEYEWNCLSGSHTTSGNFKAYHWCNSTATHFFFSSSLELIVLCNNFYIIFVHALISKSFQTNTWNFGFNNMVYGAMLED